MFLGRWDEALAFLQTAIALFISIEEPGVSVQLASLATVYRNRGEVQQAFECLREAETWIRRVASTQNRNWLEAGRLRALGNLYGQIGDPYHALRAEVQARVHYSRAHSEWTAGASLGNIAEHYAELGDYDHAIEAARKSYLSARRFRDPSEQERNLENLASFEMATGHPRIAQALLQRAMTFGDQVYTRSFEAGALLGLSEVEIELGHLERATELAENAVRILDEFGGLDEKTDGHVQLGQKYLAGSQLDKAAAEFQSAQKLAGCGSCAIVSHRGMADVLRRRGDLVGALEELKSAMALMEIERSRIAAPDLRTTFEADRARVYEDALAVIGALRDIHPSTTYDREALEVAEKAKARSFLDQLAESSARFKPILTPEESKRYAEMQSTLSKAHSELIRSPSAQNREIMQRTEQELEDWTMVLRDRHPELSHFEKPLKVDQIESFVRRHGIGVVEFALGDSRSFAWTINAQGVRMVNLPARDVIEKQVRAFREVIQWPPAGRAVSVEYARRAHQLYRTLGGDALLSGNSLVVVPDGILHYVPFQALTTTPTGRYVIEQSVISYAPSVSALVALERRPAVAPHRELIAYGDPWFGQGAVASQRLAMRVRGSYASVGMSLGALLGTRVEVDGIGKLYPPASRKILLGRQATEQSVKTEHLGDYRRIHFATHAVLDERVPSRSGIVLSLAASGEEDGILRRTEIMDLKLNADLVVLSACESGLGKLVRGEGMIGLTSAFLYAGARHVAVSLWPVNDTSTADLMKDFYVEMNRGADPAGALRAAQLKMLRSPQRAWRHPYFWAAFVVSGQ